MLGKVVSGPFYTLRVRTLASINFKLRLGRRRMILYKKFIAAQNPVLSPSGQRMRIGEASASIEKIGVYGLRMFGLAKPKAITKFKSYFV